MKRLHTRREFSQDKAIDALDEAGSRVYINNMDVPQEIVDLEQKLEDVRKEKNSVVKKQEKLITSACFQTLLTNGFLACTFADHGLICLDVLLISNTGQRQS